MPAPEVRGEQRPPLYIQIASTLRDRIVDGTYQLGALIPTEVDLSEEFATSRNTVREALRRLVEQGLVRRRQGAGTVVVSTTPNGKYVQSFDTLEDLFANATNTHYALHEISHVMLDAELAELVGPGSTGKWLKVTGVRWTERGGTPISYIESFVPLEFEAVVQTFWQARLPFYSILEKASGSTIDDLVQEIRAVEMPRRVANTFGLPEGSLSLQLLRRYVSRRGVLITSINWHRADHFTYQMKIRRHVDSPG